jgi:cysteine sulfinate desulfinase/cysteine desulfurase-like protein
MNIHGGVRFSVGAFNTEAQIEAAIEAMKEITRWKETRKTQPVSKCHSR